MEGMVHALQCHGNHPPALGLITFIAFLVIAELLH